MNAFNLTRSAGSETPLPAAVSDFLADHLINSYATPPTNGMSGIWVRRRIGKEILPTHIISNVSNKEKRSIEVTITMRIKLVPHRG